MYVFWLTTLNFTFNLLFKDEINFIVFRKSMENIFGEEIL